MIVKIGYKVTGIRLRGLKYRGLAEFSNPTENILSKDLENDFILYNLPYPTTTLLALIAWNSSLKS